MEEIKKELAEMKEILSKLLAFQQKEFNLKYVEPFRVPKEKTTNRIDTPQEILNNTISKSLEGGKKVE